MKSNKQRELEKQSLVSSHWAYKGKAIKLRIDTYRFDHGTKITEIVDHPGAVVIVPIDEKGRVLLIQQWRKGVDEILLELPAGTLEKNEPPELCAKRELREETGFAATTMIDLGGFFSAPGFCNEYLHLFAALDLHASPLPPDEDEHIDLVLTPIPDAIRMIEENKIHDAKTIAGLFKYQLWKTRCAKP